MNKLFISYSHDDLLFTQRLVDNLEENGLDIWVDFDDIRSGDDWGEAIQRGLDECDYLILVLTPASMRSRRVREEWRYFKHHDKPLFPLLLRETKVDFQLLQLQYVDFLSQPYEQAFDQLLSELWRHGVKFNFDPRNSVELPPQRELPPAPEVESSIALVKPPYLQPKSEFLRAPDMIGNVRHELWLSGIAVDKMLDCEAAIAALMQRGGVIRCLFVAPDTEIGLLDTSRYVGHGVEEMKRRLVNTQRKLAPLLKAYPRQVQVKRMAQRPSVGYFISDPSEDQGVMTVSPYFYKVDQRVCEDAECEPPFLYLEKRWDNRWFEVFKGDFQELWKWAEAWTPPRSMPDWE